MAYGFSVFWLPLARAVGVPRGRVFGGHELVRQDPFRRNVIGPFHCSAGCTRCSSYSWAARPRLFGRWVENAGPRKAGVVAACCWGGGLLIAALGVYVHQILLLWLGAGVIGGIGLGLGYISPVSTLIKWFPDRRGMATGMAIMGFGGGAMVGAPFANLLMDFFASETDVGVWQTFLVLGAIYFVACRGRIGLSSAADGFEFRANAAACRQLCSVTPFIAHAILADVGRVVSQRLGRHRRPGHGIADDSGNVRRPVNWRRCAAFHLEFGPARSRQGDRGGFRGAIVDVQHRWPHFLGVVLGLGRQENHLFDFLPCRRNVIRDRAMDGRDPERRVVRGGVVRDLLDVRRRVRSHSGILADLFGSAQISAIHGRLLTAWSVAGILGPVAVNYIRDWQLARGLPAAEAYDATMYLLAGSLVVGLMCNLLIRPVRTDFFEKAEQTSAASIAPGSPPTISTPKDWWLVGLAWLAVGIPLLWGVWNTLTTARAFFD